MESTPSGKSTRPCRGGNGPEGHHFRSETDPPRTEVGLSSLLPPGLRSRTGTRDTGSAHLFLCRAFLSAESGDYTLAGVILYRALEELLHTRYPAPDAASFHRLNSLRAAFRLPVRHQVPAHWGVTDRLLLLWDRSYLVGDELWMQTVLEVLQYRHAAWLIHGHRSIDEQQWTRMVAMLLPLFPLWEE